MHVEVFTAYPWLSVSLRRKSKSSQQPARPHTTCLHHLPALISSILLLAHSGESHWLLPYSPNTPQGLCTCSSLLACSSPTEFPPSLPLGVSSEVTSTARPLTPFLHLMFFLIPCPQAKTLLYFPCLVHCSSPLLGYKLYASRDFCPLCSLFCHQHLGHHVLHSRC